MVRIGRIKLRGFKSFRHSDAEFPGGFVAIAGPNGSGKSNIVDGIRFALGETSLKSLRAKKVSGLINQSCTMADVTLYLEAGGSKEKGIELRRAIRSDAKVLYKLDSHRTTRTSVLEALRQEGVESTGHNIIAQGQVQRLIDMNPKERREIIDTAAGISEYEQKKKEAMGELEAVAQKISDANIVLAEREGFLGELAKERDSALEYLSAQKGLSGSRAALVGLELSKLQSQHDEVSRKCLTLKGEFESMESAIASLDLQISQFEAKKSELTQKLGGGAKRESLLSQIESLKVSIAQSKTAAEEKRKAAEKLQERIGLLSRQKSEAEAIISRIASEAADAKKKAEGEGRLAKSLSAQKTREQQEEKAEEELGKAESGIEECRANLSKSESHSAKLSEAIRIRSDELSRLRQTSQRTLPVESLTSQLESVQKDVSSLGRDSSKCFEEEKQLNRKLADIDRKSLEIRERIAVARVNAAPQSANPALKAMELLAAKNKGVLGTVSSLIKFDPSHSVAIEAAAGQRLSYVVVDTVETAQECIEYLKREKAGRCTLIPLDKVSVSPHDMRDAAKAQGCLALLLDCVEFDRKYYSAMQFVFGDTLLFDSFADAKRFAGKARIVTLEGELFERSGIITGGSIRAGITARAALERLEAEFVSIKAERDSLYQQLYSARESQSRIRKEKAELEVRARSLELELENASAVAQKGKAEQEAIRAAQKEIAGWQGELSALSEGKKGLLAQLSSLAKSKESLLQKISQEKAHKAAAQSELEEKIRSILSSASSLLAVFEGKQNELRVHQSQLSALEGERKNANDERESLKSEISSLGALASSDSKKQSELEAELVELSAASQKLYSKLKEMEASVSELAKSKGKMLQSKESHSRALNELEVKKATVQTRLADLLAQSEQYRGVTPLSGTKEELGRIAEEAEAKMASLGAVNLKAPELYEEKRKDIEQVKSRVSQLSSERAAVLSMIDEIEGKKRSIFLDTFKVVNEHFRKLYSMIMQGEGFLLLDTPTDPFNSGLQIKVRHEGKDRYIDSMSGGEKSLLALIFIFAIQMFKPAPFYILDEADAALDKENSKRLSSLLQQMSKRTQFIVVTHNDTILSAADVALGVTRTAEGSKIVGVQLTQSAPIVARVQAKPG